MASHDKPRRMIRVAACGSVVPGTARNRGPTQATLAARPLQRPLQEPGPAGPPRNTPLVFFRFFYRSVI